MATAKAVLHLAVLGLLMMQLATPLHAAATAKKASTSMPLKLADDLTTDNICSAVQHHAQKLAGAIAAGCKSAEAAGQGKVYAGYIADALVASVGKCLDGYFEVVNQAIIVGGEAAEKVVAYALVAAAANGVDAPAAKVVATATAKVICNGGDSASACARAWARAVTLDAKGCAVLKVAYAHAKASCGPEGAKAQSTSYTFIKPLGICKVPDFNDADGGDAVAKSTANAWAEGGGDATASSTANAWGGDGGDATASSTANAWAKDGGDATADSTANAWGDDGGDASASSTANAKSEDGGNAMASSTANAWGGRRLMALP